MGLTRARSVSRGYIYVRVRLQVELSGTDQDRHGSSVLQMAHSTQLTQLLLPALRFRPQRSEAVVSGKL